MSGISHVSTCKHFGYKPTIYNACSQSVHDTDHCASCATAIDAVRTEKGKEGKETVRTYDS